MLSTSVEKPITALIRTLSFVLGLQDNLAFCYKFTRNCLTKILIFIVHLDGNEARDLHAAVFLDDAVDP